MEKQLVVDSHSYSWFWNGFKWGYKECCIMYFCYEYVGHKFLEVDTWYMPDSKDGYIRCPNCIVRKMT